MGKLPWGAAESWSDAEKEERGGLQGALRAEANADKGVGKQTWRQSALLGHRWTVGEGEAEQQVEDSHERLHQVSQEWRGQICVWKAPVGSYRRTDWRETKLDAGCPVRRWLYNS